MPKREANKQLNYHNWEDEDDAPDEPAPDEKRNLATKEEISKRPIKVAKRRSQGAHSGVGGLGGVFSGFAGFGQKPKPSLVENAPEPKPGVPLATTVPEQSIEPPPTEMYSSVEYGPEVTNEEPNENMDFLEDLKELNESVTRWIKDHIAQNPYVDLTPVFADYNKHLKMLDEKYGSKNPNIQINFGKTNYDKVQKIEFSAKRTKEDKQEDSWIETKSTQKPFNTSGSVEKPGFFKEKLSTTEPKPISFGTGPSLFPTPLVSTGSGFNASPFSFEPNPIENENKMQIGAFGTKSGQQVSGSEFSAGSFSFGLKPKESGNAEKSGTVETKSGFGRKSSDVAVTAAPSLENAGTTPIFSFKGVEPKAPVGGGEDDEPYEPPKPETVSIEEKDAFYDTKCKLFFKKEGKFVEKGVGTLYLKPMEGGKTQLLIRADTALGNVLLNVGVQPATPVAKLKKNNVTVVCVANPPLGKQPDQTPTTFLLRVKTEQDADTLVEKLIEAKGKAG